MTDSTAFASLHPLVQKWIWSQQWSGLREVQERAVEPILAGDRDVIIAASTASGKTEAVFLPICSALLEEGAETETGGVQALYVSPLKALINDQYGRLDDLCKYTDLIVHRWHGDVPGSRKHMVLKHPSGILLITPESLEALFVLHGEKIQGLFGGLRYIVVDEVHTFIGTERGAQLRSLMYRLELSVRHKTARIGLSATLGDMGAACDWLRPAGGDDVVLIDTKGDGNELRLQVRGYVSMAHKSMPARGESGAERDADGDLIAIADHLFSVHRGRDGLVFANSRGAVEQITDSLSRRCERDRVPNEFVPHHGNLSRALREDAETRLKDRTKPVTAVCTSTLEMGVDIGSVAAVAQIGPPPSVASLRQRLGRSGRRGEAAVLRAYVSEHEVTAGSSLADQVRVGLVQTSAMIELLLCGWCEAPTSGGLHLSTLVQQLLSMIAQHGGIKPAEAYGALCGHGPFEHVSQRVFAGLLRSLGARDLVTQQADGLLLLGLAGERLVNHYSFYAAFATAEEYRLIADGQLLGTLPIGHPISVGSLIIFAGRRWRVTAVDSRDRTVELTRSSGGRPPLFSGGSALIDDTVRQRMLGIYVTDEFPSYIDRQARELLAEARRNFARYKLDCTRYVAAGRETHLLVWRSDKIVSTLAVALSACGFEVSQHAMILSVGADEATLIEAICSLAEREPPDALELARHVQNKVIDKWDEVLDDDLLDLACAHRDLDVEGAWRELARLAT
jgi:ATP-dependent helicase Lhr and Lhr-like helicase